MVMTYISSKMATHLILSPLNSTVETEFLVSPAPGQISSTRSKNGQIVGLLLPLNRRHLLLVKRDRRWTLVYSGSTVPLGRGRLLSPIQWLFPGMRSEFLVRVSSVPEMTRRAVILNSYSLRSLINWGSSTVVFETRSVKW